MATIEERAKELVKRILFAYKDGQSLEHMTKVAESYLTEQKKVDIEKACEFFVAYLVEIGYPDDWCRDSKVQKSGEQRFREFMEE